MFEELWEIMYCEVGLVFEDRFRDNIKKRKKGYGKS